MFKIGEFSLFTQISIRMLRYYDEVGLLRPDKIDHLTGYRMYTAKQLPIANKIVYLRDSRFTVSEIINFLNGEDQVEVLECLNQKYSEIETKIAEEQNKLVKIAWAKDELEKEKSDFHYQVMIKSVPSRLALSLRKIVPSYYDEEELCRELVTFAEEQKIVLVDDAFAIYHDQEYKEENVDIELCVPIKGQIPQIENDTFSIHKTEEFSLMASMMVYGEFSNIAQVYLSLADWLDSHLAFRINGSTRQIVHYGPWNESEPSNYLTEIQIPLEKIG